MLRVLHVFRNTPLGRETLLQSLHLCERLGFSLDVYVPTERNFLMYFDNDVIQIDLDSSYLTAPDSAVKRVEELVGEREIEMRRIGPESFTADTLPNVPTDCDLMCCPRSMSDPAPKIGLGHIGPRVRRIIQVASFPVFVPSPVYKQWNSLAVMFGGSSNAVNALRLAVTLSQLVDLPVDLFSHVKGRKQRREDLEEILESAGLTDAMSTHVRSWRFLESRSVEEGLYDVPHDALVLMGAYGHGLVKELLFGSFMETVQGTMPNSLLVVGPNCNSTCLATA